MRNDGVWPVPRPGWGARGLGAGRGPAGDVGGGWGRGQVKGVEWCEGVACGSGLGCGDGEAWPGSIGHKTVGEGAALVSPPSHPLAAQMVITDLSAPEERPAALSRLGLCFGVGVIFGSLLGGTLSSTCG